jgi:hypothetical protein
MNYNDLYRMQRDLEDVANLSEMLGRDDVAVRVCSIKGRSVLLLRDDDLEGVLRELAVYFEKKILNLRERGYTGNLSEVVLD